MQAIPLGCCTTIWDEQRTPFQSSQNFSKRILNSRAGVIFNIGYTNSVSAGPGGMTCLPFVPLNHSGKAKADQEVQQTPPTRIPPFVEIIVFPRQKTGTVSNFEIAPVPVFHNCSLIPDVACSEVIPLRN